MAVNSYFQKKELSNNFKGSKSTIDHSYLVKRFRNKNHKRDLLKENTICKMENAKDALLLHGNFSDGKDIIALNTKDIESITVVRGEENINTFFMSPMWISLKLGVPVQRARHFKISNSEYQINDTKIVLQTKECLVELLTSGSAFEKLCHTFQNEQYNTILKIVYNKNVKIKKALV